MITNIRQTSIQSHFPYSSPELRRIFSLDNYRYSYNGKEQDNEIKGTGNSLDFGARMYDSRLGRWLSTDPRTANYPGVSPYCFVNNTPLMAIDPDGEKVYYVIYTGGSNDAYEAAITRVNEIQTSESFDKTKDVVVFATITDLGKLEDLAKTSTKYYEQQGYGKTAEVSFFGHHGTDGPSGSEEASKNNLADVTGSRGAEGDQLQLSPTGWKNIDFNFDPNGSIAAFYGCMSSEFAEKFLVYQPTVTYTAGITGKAGGSYTYQGGFDSRWFNLYGKDVYMVSETDGQVDARYVFGRSSSTLVGQSYQDSEGINIPMRRPEEEINGNVTIDDSTKKPTNGSD